MRHPDDMQSMGEVLAAGGWQPREPDPNHKTDYHQVEAAAWERERPKVWGYMLANGVPPKLVDDLKGGGVESSDAILAVEQYLANPAVLLLLLMGRPQVGKSLACAYGLSTRTRKERTFQAPQTDYQRERNIPAEPTMTWTKWDNDYVWIRTNSIGSIDRFDIDGKARLRRLETTRLLVLDEIGGESWGDVTKKVDDLIGKRWDAGLCTMMTTNLDAHGLRQAVGDRVSERIKRVGRVVECSDFRQGAA